MAAAVDMEVAAVVDIATEVAAEDTTMVAAVVDIATEAAAEDTDLAVEVATATETADIVAAAAVVLAVLAAAVDMEITEATFQLWLDHIQAQRPLLQLQH